MAIVEIPGGVFLPAPIQFDEDAVPGFTEYTLDTTRRKVAFILRVPRLGEASGDTATYMERFEFMIGTVTQNPVNGLKVSFQDITNEGVPVNSADYFFDIPTGNIVANTWTIPTYLTSNGLSDGTRRPVAHGELVACVIEFGNFVLGDSLVIKVLTQDLYAMKGAYTLTASILGAWTKVTGSPVMALVYYSPVGGVYSYMPLSDTYAVSNLSNEILEGSSDPNEAGLAFTLPAPMRVGGAYVMLEPYGTDDFDVVLYDAETSTELERITVNVTNYFPNGGGIDYIYVRFTEDFLLQGNHIYILSVVPSGEMSAYYIDTYSATQMASLPGGTTWHWRQRASGGNWTVITNRRPLFGIHITGVDHEVSGSGGGSGWQGNP